MIRSSAFGPVRLTGKDAAHFKEALNQPADPVVFRLADLGRAMALEAARDDQRPASPEHREPGGR